MSSNFPLLADFLGFIVERERIRKERGDPWPWSRDPVLRNFPFCCIRREHDATTIWLYKNWCLQHWDDDDYWFAVAVARLGSKHVATLAELGYPVPWDPERFISVIRSRKARGLPVESAAYMLRADRTRQYSEKARYPRRWC